MALQGFRAQASFHAFQCLLLAKRPEEARKWIALARSQLEMSRGAEHPDVLALRGYEEDPLSHPAASDASVQWTSVATTAVPVLAVAAAAWFALRE